VVLDNAEMNAGPEDITKLAKPNIHLSSSHVYFNQSLSIVGGGMETLYKQVKNTGRVNLELLEMA
jgi:hypothetical protein